MKNMIFIKTKQITHLIIALSVLAFIIFSFNKKLIKAPLTISKQQSALNIETNIYRYLNFGQIRLLVDLLWIQTVIESDLDHYKEKDLNSWMYHRFNTITELDQKFYLAHLFGGQYLSIVKDDDEGAKVIFDKGLARFWGDYRIHFAAGYHYLFEIFDKKKAIEVYTAILNHPKSPHYLSSLVARLKTEEEGLESAFVLLEEGYKNTPDDSPFKLSYRKNLYALKAEIDLKCLNSHQKNCSTLDYEGRPYIATSLGTYRAEQDWEPFRKRKM